MSELIALAPGCYCTKDELDNKLMRLKEAFGEGPYSPAQVLYLELQGLFPSEDENFEDFCESFTERVVNND